VHGTGVYSAGVGPKGPALERFLDIKKNKCAFYSWLAENFGQALYPVLQRLLSALCLVL
jgi:hypothetical protein